jgi:hypothetical protein
VAVGAIVTTSRPLCDRIVRTVIWALSLWGAPGTARKIVRRPKWTPDEPIESVTWRLEQKVGANGVDDKTRPPTIDAAVRRLPRQARRDGADTYGSKARPATFANSRNEFRWR